MSELTGRRLRERAAPPTRSRRRWPAFRLGGWLLLLCVLPCACGGPHRFTGPPNILLISIDTLRRDHLGCYGYERSTTPHLDALAKSGLAFTQVRSTSSWTLPAHASMLTGLYPSFHGLQDEGVKLQAAIPTLAEHLGRAGYRTLAVISHLYVSSRFGLDRGFETFDESLLEGAKVEPRAGQVVDHALRLLSADDSRPFFAFVHLYDPHWDYTPPAPFDTRYTDPQYRGPIDGTLHSLAPYVDGSAKMSEADLQHAVDLYDGEIAYTDQEIQRLLDGLRNHGRLGNTVVVIVADHGEEFLDHERLGHQKSLFGEVLRVPLIFSGLPRDRARSTVPDRQASLVDLAPTLLELAGAEPLPGGMGESLLAPPATPDRNVFAESRRFGNEIRAVVGPRYKLIHYLQGDNKFFYDLQLDPHEKWPMGKDLSAGALSTALGDYAQVADQGWHLKLINLHKEPLRCQATLQTTGRFIAPQRYFTGDLGDPTKVHFSTFELDSAQTTFCFDLVLSDLMGDIQFKVDPPTAPVTFRVTVLSAEPEAGVYLGTGQRISTGQPLALQPDDPRLAGLPPSYVTAAAGCYIRTVEAPAGEQSGSQLTAEEIQRLRALGY